MTKLCDRALRLLAVRNHSRAELRRKLLHGRPGALDRVEEILDQLERQGYLNDGEFAYQRALHQHRKHWGLRRIGQDLKNLGIREEIIGPTLERLGGEAGEMEGLQQAIQRWVDRSGAPQTPSQLKKLYDRCLRLGYPSEPVRRHLAPYFESMDWGSDRDPTRQGKR